MPDFTREEVIAKVAAGESLEFADLSNADLLRAALSGANLHKTNLNMATIVDVDTIYNKDTIFPKGFDPEAAGMLLVE
jgi:uncharacterized protein YjbI with pentapeptide repeats